MRSSLLLSLLVTLVSCQTITEPDILAEDPPEAENSAFRVIGYHTWWAGADWQRYDFGSLDALYFFSLEIGPDGTVVNDRGWPDDWRGMIATARGTQTAVVPTISILDADTYLSVFSDSVAVDSLVSAITRIALDTAADGVHLDFEMFEAVPPEARQAVTDVVSRVRSALDEQRPQALITMYMLAQDPADVLDEIALAPLLDRLIVQAYDLHWQSGDTAGPVAPVDGWGTRNWKTILGRFESMGIPSQKMIFTIPYFGYEWPTEDENPGSATRGQGIVLAYGSGTIGIPSASARAALHGKLRDPGSGSPYYAYQDSLGWNQGWFEDAQSVSAKYSFVMEHGLEGVAIFPLSYGDVELMATLNSARSGALAVVAP